MKKRDNRWIYGLRYASLLLVVLFGYMTIVGSSGSSSSSGGDSEEVTGGSGNPVDMNGTWVEACEPDEDSGESEQFSTTISGSSFTNTMKVWVSSTTCSGDPDIVVLMSGTFTLGETVTVSLDSSSVSATKVEGSVSSYTGTIKNSDVVTGFNEDKECGYDDWAVDTPKELIDNATCGPESKTFKDILYVDDTADPDLWYSGDDGAGLDTDGYPTILDESSPAQRS